MVRIEGLSKPHFRRAVRDKRLPFLKGLLENQDYHLLSHYSGLPSATPAMQGELFYGVHCAVPSLRFYDRRSRQPASMLDLETATAIEEEIASGRTPLLSGGSSYANVFHGGAPQNRFCLSSTGSGTSLPPGRLGLAARLFRIYTLMPVRFLTEAVVELILALGWLVQRPPKRARVFQRLRSLFSRVGICVLLRELTKARILIDLAQGIPIVHGSLLGYDEQAHEGGPSSGRAARALRGIDRTVAELWHAAKSSPLVDYDVWIYSDHGQETVEPYRMHSGGGIAEAVREAARHSGLSRPIGVESARGRDGQHIADGQQSASSSGGIAHTYGHGSLWHVYLPESVEHDMRDRFAHRLIHTHGIPLVLGAEAPQHAVAWTTKGRYLLPDQVDSVVGSHHPFREDIRYDLVRLVHHPNAGALVLCGWRPQGIALSFQTEQGAHGGPGRQETHGFALLPGTVSQHVADRSYVRPRDMRLAALKTLERSSSGVSPRSTAPAGERGTFRLMTYNTHGCIGADGATAPERIARVIARHGPDIVVLQELDVGRQRTGGTDQAQRIAGDLDMFFHYHPSYMLAEGSYGNAILSRFPLRLVKTGVLPGNGNAEPRGALWVEVTDGDHRIQVIGTHLSFYPRERHRQVLALLDEGWIDDTVSHGGVALCGDLNLISRSRSYRALSSRLRDAHTQVPGMPRARTWMGFACLDYIFVGSELSVASVHVPQNHLTRRASDHFPVIAELKTSRPSPPSSEAAHDR